MLGPKDAGKRILALPPEQRLRELNLALGIGPTPRPTSDLGRAVLARNAALVTYLRAECDRRGIWPPWNDPVSIAGRA